MKKLIFLLCFASLTILCSAQPSYKLDQKRGFKQFKIGDSYSKWYKDLAFPRPGTLPNSTLYKYVGNCCQTVFGYKIYNIDLQFKNHQLITIFITLDRWEKPLYANQYTDIDNCFKKIEDLVAKLSYLFDKPTGFQAEEGSGDATFSWTGLKTILFLSLRYEGITEGCTAYIIIGDLNSIEKEIENGF